MGRTVSGETLSPGKAETDADRSATDGVPQTTPRRKRRWSTNSSFSCISKSSRVRFSRLCIVWKNKAGCSPIGGSRKQPARQVLQANRSGASPAGSRNQEVGPHCAGDYANARSILRAPVATAKKSAPLSRKNSRPYLRRISDDVGRRRGFGRRAGQLWFRCDRRCG